MSDELIDQMAGLAAGRGDAALCLVVRTEGSTPLKAGAWMIVHDDGSTAGTIGGGALEHAVTAQAIEAIAGNHPALTEHRLVRDHNMCCGGTVHVFIEPLPQPDQLYIFGAGHVGAALAAIADQLPFRITVVDDRDGIFEGWPERGERRLNIPASDALRMLAWSPRTYIVIATYSHPLDREILAYALCQPHAYCGMIGSARKVAVTKTLFTEQRWATAEQLDRVDMPIGLDIGAVTPGEIAASIAARLVAARHHKEPARAGIDPCEDAVAECLDYLRRQA